MSGIVTEAAEHALRWILSTCPKGTHRPGADWEKKDAEASELLGWAIGYSQLYVDHTAWSRGMMTARVDEQARTIVFDYPTGQTRVLSEQLDSNSARSDAFKQTIPQTVEDRIVKPWIQEAIWDAQELPTLTLDRKSVEFSEVEQWGLKMVLPEIAGDRDLGGFTLSDFRQFYIGLWLYCHSITRLEDMADRAIGLNNPFGSRFVQGRREYVTYWLSQVCALPTETLDRVLELLTFDPAARHPSLPGHPFVPTVDRALTLTTRLFARTEPDVMLCVALNSKPTRQIYESIIEEIEVAAKRRLATLFKDHNYAVWDDPSLLRPGTDPLTPDLVVARGNEKWIVVIEYKHALPPLGGAGVSDRIKETSNWIKKAKRYLSAAKLQLGRIQKRLMIPEDERRVAVAIVPRWPMPVPISLDADEIVLADVSRVQRSLDRNASIAEVFGLGALPFQPSMKRDFHEIRVGDWTYKHPILVGDIEDSVP